MVREEEDIRIDFWRERRVHLPRSSREAATQSTDWPQQERHIEEYHCWKQWAGSALCLQSTLRTTLVNWFLSKMSSSIHLRDQHRRCLRIQFFRQFSGDSETLSCFQWILRLMALRCLQMSCFYFIFLYLWLEETLCLVFCIFYQFVTDNTTSGTLTISLWINQFTS